MNFDPPVPDPPVRDPKVRHWLETLEHARKEELLAVRALILAAVPDVEEGFKWNVASYRTPDVPGQKPGSGEWFATFHVRGKTAAESLSVILHTGPKLRERARVDVPDPVGLLRWLGPDRAMIRFESAAMLQEQAAAFQELVRAWRARV